MSNRILRVLIPFFIVVGGIVAFAVLVKTRPVPQKATARHEGVLVDTMVVASTTEVVKLPGKGTIAPAQVVALQSEVSGRVVWHSPNLVPGGRFKKGELLLRVDPRDYQIAVEQQASAVDRAQLDVETEQSRKVVAAQEWELLSKNKNWATPTKPEDSLALRGPQLRTAKASLHSAAQGLERAQLGLQRTVIRAPWNGMVKDEQVDVGQLVSPQQPLGTLVGTDEYWVQVSIPLDWLVWLTDAQGQIKRVPATIWTELGGQRLQRQGEVIRLLGDVDPVGRMARLLVAIKDPLGLAEETAAKTNKRVVQKRGEGKQNEASTAPLAPALPLLVGTYVNVDIEASYLGSVFAIPDRALRDGKNVHIVGQQNKLEIRPVTVVFRNSEFAYISQGLAPGEKIVLSRLATSVPGMLLRTHATTPLAEETKLPKAEAPQ